MSTGYKVALLLTWATCTVAWGVLTWHVDWRLTLALVFFAMGDNVSESLRRT